MPLAMARKTHQCASHYLVPFMVMGSLVPSNPTPRRVEGARNSDSDPPFFCSNVSLVSIPKELQATHLLVNPQEGVHIPVGRVGRGAVTPRKAPKALLVSSLSQGRLVSPPWRL